MGTGGFKSIALFIVFNLMLFNCVTSNKVPCPPKITPSPAPVPKTQGKCPKDTLKFGVCGSWLGLVTEVVGTKPSKECCTLIKGLADLEAALCLCTAIKANVLGVIKVKVPIAVSLLVNACGKKVPEGFVCA
ncbi:HMW glutenin [Trema orientale]|uniref:HMW glutenin n=1 Tax=Trema orientale TaxID=63057 RepID=A0A2P5CLG1_TREOI|nr:HMW glutenin [Trema orientale]